MADGASAAMLSNAIVPNSEIRQNPFATSIPYADAVVEAPFGSHPYASHGHYVEDEEAIQDYVAASIAYRKNDMAAWRGYLDAWVSGPASHGDYLRKLSGERLCKLRNAGLA